VPSLSDSAPRARTNGRPRAPHLGPERRRPLVLDAALRLFVERGYRATSMEAIAAAAGVTKPVVYECYPGKEELFRALLEREEERLLSAVLAALPATPRFDDLEGMLTDGVTALLVAAAERPDSWRVVFDSEHGTEPAVARRVRKARETVVGRLREMTELYLGQLGTEDLERKAPVLAELLAALSEASVRVLLSSDGGWTPEELGAYVARVTARGPIAA
jgi:AcrR family transcriptional regulator